MRLHAPVHVTGTYYGYADGIWRRHSSARSISRERAVIKSCYRLTKDNLTFEGYVRNITKHLTRINYGDSLLFLSEFNRA